MYVCVYIYGYSIFKSSLSDIHNLVGVYVYIYIYIYICIYVYMYICIYVYMYICKYVHMYPAAGWRPRSLPFVGRFHTMDLDSFRKGIKEEFFQ